MKLALLLFASALSQGLLAQSPYVPLANHVVTVADDFVVEVYHNGKLVPDSKRKMIGEIHGASAERINIKVHKHDWIVFNVVNNRLRWNGVSYFAVAGILDDKEFGFTSQLDVQSWTYCDDLDDVDEFIANRITGKKALKIKNPWADGDGFIKKVAGSNWQGDAIWGRSRNTWIKVVLNK